MKIALCLLLCLATSAAWAAPAPKESSGSAHFERPARLVFADRFLDFTNSVAGVIVSADRKTLAFYLKATISNPRRGVFLSKSFKDPTWVTPEQMAWSETDFLLLLETVIHSQFYWDRKQQKLLANSPREFEVNPRELASDAETMEKHAEDLLRFAEERLGRKTTWMR